VYQKHETGFTQVLSNRQTLGWTQFPRKRFLQVNLAATAYETGNTFRVDGRQNSIAVPPFFEIPRADENVVFVIGMTELGGGIRNSQAGCSGGKLLILVALTTSTVPYKAPRFREQPLPGKTRLPQFLGHSWPSAGA
jgi:hypothetical protein